MNMKVTRKMLILIRMKKLIHKKMLTINAKLTLNWHLLLTENLIWPLILNMKVTRKILILIQMKAARISSQKSFRSQNIINKSCCICQWIIFSLKTTIGVLVQLSCKSFLYLLIFIAARSLQHLIPGRVVSGDLHWL